MKMVEKETQTRAMKALEMTGTALMFIFLFALVAGVIVGGALALYKAGTLFYVLGGIGGVIILWGGIFTYLTVIPTKHSTDEDDQYE